MLTMADNVSVMHALHNPVPGLVPGTHALMQPSRRKQRRGWPGQARPRGEWKSQAMSFGGGEFFPRIFHRWDRLELDVGKPAGGLLDPPPVGGLDRVARPWGARDR